MATDAEQFDGREALAELTAGDLLPILLVDDRAENLSALRAVLAPLGLPVHTATSGYEALRMLLERDYALILLDVRMPGLDGLETARLIKSRTRTHDLPIVFLTAASDEVADIVRGYGVGAVDYVIKPFNSELLRSKVAVFAELERSRRALKRSEALLRGAFEAAPIGKTVLDPSRRIVLANPAFRAPAAPRAGYARRRRGARPVPSRRPGRGPLDRRSLPAGRSRDRGWRRLVRRVRAARGTPGRGDRRCHRQGDPGGIDDGPAAQRDARLRARRRRPAHARRGPDAARQLS